MQQVRVKVWNSVFDRYEYLFTGYRQTWEPVFDFDHPVQASVHAQEELYPLKLMPREDQEWYRVVGLSEGAPSGSENYRKALADLSPESGGYIMLSTRRRRIKAHDEDDSDEKTD